jgi:hypothetical protein
MIRVRLAFSSKLEGFWTRQMQPWLIRWFAPELGEEPRTCANSNASLKPARDPADSSLWAGLAGSEHPKPRWQHAFTRIRATSVL